MENLDKPEIINMFIKQYLVKNISEEMYDFVRDLYFKLKAMYDYNGYNGEEIEQSSDDEGDLPMEKISVVKSKDGFYRLE